MPVHPFKLAIEKKPVYSRYKTWQWTYSTSHVVQFTYKARLTGQIMTYQMSYGKCTLHETGTSRFSVNLYGLRGHQNLTEQEDNGYLTSVLQSRTPILQIDWTKSGTDIGSVKYTYLQNDGLKGSYIEYGLTSADLNAFFTIYYFNGVKFSNVKIEWNTTTKNGRVQSLEYVGDSNWYCWDSNKINVTCQ